MSVTFDVSKPDTSNDDNDEHLVNMLPMSVTLDVTNFGQLAKSRDDNDEQAQNMPRMFVTFDVSKPDKSRDDNDEQP